MTERSRRIVTGHDENGKSIVLSNGETPTVVPLPDNGVVFHEIWSMGASPSRLEANEAEPTGGAIHIEPKHRGGNVLRFVDLQPASLSPMHRTETVDYGIVLDGEVFLILDDSEVHLKAGDVVIQRGTLHAWANRSNKLARMAFVLVDAVFSHQLKASLPAGALEKVFRGPMGPPR
jgi:quercetin dioxygenase-like cupin family protein